MGFKVIKRFSSVLQNGRKLEISIFYSGKWNNLYFFWVRKSDIIWKYSLVMILEESSEKRQRKTGNQVDYSQSYWFYWKRRLLKKIKMWKIWLFIEKEASDWRKEGGFKSWLKRIHEKCERDKLYELLMNR